MRNAYIYLDQKLFEFDSFFNYRLVKFSSNTRGRITSCSFVIFLLHLKHITHLNYLWLCSYRKYIPTSNNVKCIFYFLFIFLEYGFITFSLMHLNVYFCSKFETYFMGVRAKCYFPHCISHFD